MVPEPKPESPEVLAQFYGMFRDYFDRAEKKRRWSLRDDIPWDQCNPNVSNVVADLIETFCTVELYLPDYLSKLISQVRDKRGRAWTLANWGYEECKHSMGFADWLLRSKHRTDEQMADLENEVFSHEWQMPYDNSRAMIVYTMFQELATWLHYQNLRKILGGQDPALDTVLKLVAIDERAHYDFFKKIVAVYLEYDRPHTLEQIRVVANTFSMPAIHMLESGAKRISEVRAHSIFDDGIFVKQVYEPILAELKITKKDVRRRQSSREIVVVGAPSS